MAQPNLNLRERELIFCINRAEQYWQLINEKRTNRKIESKKAERLAAKVFQWEDQAEMMLGISDT